MIKNTLNDMNTTYESTENVPLESRTPALIISIAWIIYLLFAFYIFALSFMSTDSGPSFWVFIFISSVNGFPFLSMCFTTYASFLTKSKKLALCLLPIAATVLATTFWLNLTAGIFLNRQQTRLALSCPQGMYFNFDEWREKGTRACIAKTVWPICPDGQPASAIVGDTPQCH